MNSHNKLPAEPFVRSVYKRKLGLKESNLFSAFHLFHVKPGKMRDTSLLMTFLEILQILKNHL